MSTTPVKMTTQSPSKKAKREALKAGLDNAISNLGHSSSSDQWAVSHGSTGKRSERVTVFQVAGEAFRQLFIASTFDERTQLLTSLSDTFAVDHSALDSAIAIYQRVRQGIFAVGPRTARRIRQRRRQR